MKRKVVMLWMLVLPSVLLISILTGGGCGKSPGHAEMTATNIIILTELNFQDEVITSPKPVLVDFWAPWCGPCRTISPIVNELARDFDGRAKVAKANVDDVPALAQRFGIQGIPALLIFRGGRVVDQVMGIVSKRELTAKLDKVIAESVQQSGAGTAVSTNR